MELARAAGIESIGRMVGESVTGPSPAAEVQEQFVNPGINLRVGAADDGWRTPPPVVLSDGTRIQLFKDGEGLSVAYEAIKAARKLVCLEVYIFGEDETGRAFAELLARKAAQGVKVYVIYDSFGTRGLAGEEPDMFRRMRASGVRVQSFHPMRPWECQYGWRPLNRDHRKLLVIDGDSAGLGGLNIAGEYAGSWVVPSRSEPCDFWRDNAIGIQGPGARLLMQSFARTWNYVAHGGRARRAEFIHNLQEGELGVMAVVPTLNSPLRPFLYRMLREARRSILMTMAYFAPDDPLIDGLCKAARRGVKVRLMLPGKCDVPVVRLCTRSFYETLLTAGVEIYERQCSVLHAKTMVVDEHTSVIGSTNLDYRSIEYNCELSAIIRSDEFGRQMCSLFENDMGFAKQIHLPQWRKRPVWDRFVLWAVSRARYLL
ncbi:MAG TPA: phospholipase D-like domain-containing protein [Tepidisphaeraceae bacterium]|jgi:cardiolipin synthase|nr:phospholipase D-like domain-containing protein [Tepidisphaeraceae bacterium]